MKALLQRVLRLLFRVEVRGLENYQQAGDNVVIVANHTSYLDPILLYAFLPKPMTFAVNTYVAKHWSLRMISRFINFFALDPTNPLSIRSLIKRVKEGGHIVIFPEGRITVTGSLMKIYHGPGLVTDKANATVLPVCINGPQYSIFSKAKGKLTQRWFPKCELTILPATTIRVADDIRGRERREQAGKQLADIMTQMLFTASPTCQTLISALVNARMRHGGSMHVMEDVQREPVSYDQLIVRSLALASALKAHAKQNDNVGVLLPASTANVVTFFALQSIGCVPAMLNFTVGEQGIRLACETAQISTIITSRRFIAMGKMDEIAESMAQGRKVIYLEDLASTISVGAKIKAKLLAKSASLVKSIANKASRSDDPAVILFTSGSEGAPKGVVLSHHNLLSNVYQMAARVDFSEQDVVLNALPLFHSFGLMAGTLLPILGGMKTFLYPTPLHYRIVPEIAYDIGATIMFGTNTFLAGYARFAHPYDFFSMRYVFAGAEKLKDEVREVWERKFGVRIFEGYGATETSPVLACNTPIDHKPGSVGRLMPGINYYLEPIPGVTEGARLHVKGPNIMLGYLFHDKPGQRVAPSSLHGAGWYDTGDIVQLDNNGFITICGRAKRFAKIAGEMVSLTVVEQLVCRTWPDYQHAVVAIPDERKGEQLVLLTEYAGAERAAIVSQAHSDGISELNVPRTIKKVARVPLLGTGKIDYVTVRVLAEAVA